jgi:hypothetical protein
MIKKNQEVGFRNVKLDSLNDVLEELEQQQGEYRDLQVIICSSTLEQEDELEVCRENIEWTEAIIKGLKTILNEFGK